MKYSAGILGVFLVFAAAISSLPTLRARENLRLITKAEDVRRLSPSLSAKGYPVRLSGIVTYADADWRVLFIQDQSGGIQIEPEQQNHSLQPGQLVEVTGVSAPGNISPVVSKATVTLIGSTGLPSARTVRMSQLNLRNDESQWLRFENLVVQNAYEEGHDTVLDAYEREHRIQIRMSGFAQESASSLIDAKVSANGVLGVTTDSAHNPIGFMLWVPRGFGISVTAAPPAIPNQLPVTPVAELEKTWESSPPQHRIRIQGTVMPGEKESTLLVQDKSGIIAAQPLFSRPIAPGDEVDLTGFADLSSANPRIINATYLRIKASAIESAQEPGLPVLTKIGQIRHLSSKEATRGYPVRIKGVLTYHNPQLSMTFIQDEGDAVYIQSLDPLMALSAGEKYEVEGFTAPGDFAPIIIKPKYRLLGPAPKPPAKYVTLHQLSTGEYDCLRVQVRGIVRSVRQVGNRWCLELFSEGKAIEVWTPYFPSSGEILSLQDARILVQGICSIQISPWGTVAGFRLNVPSIDEIKVEERARSDLFSAPLRSIRDMFRYSSREESEHRVRIEGTLLHQQPGKALYIKDKTGTISIPVSHVMPVSSNDLIAVSGYPALGPYTPTLEHVLVKRLSTGSPSQIPLVPSARALSSNSHGSLVRIRAKLVDQWRNNDGETFLLQDIPDPHTSFEAILEKSPKDFGTTNLRTGSEVELTGIYLFQRGGSQQLGFQLLLRTPEDVRLIKAAPWWTLKHLYWAFGILLCLILFASIWAGMLKSRVNRQTAIIQQRLEAEAALQKKYQELFEGSHDIVFACDETGALKSINPSGSRTLGYSSEELVTLDPRKLIAPSSLAKIIRWIDEKSKGIQCSTLECELLSKDGRRILVEVNSQIFQSNGRITGAQGIARDITERKQAEEALRQSEEKLRQGQKLEAIGRLAGGIAHDFNNILSAILGFAELSMDEVPRDHPITPNLEQIVKAGKRARDLVQQILAFSRKLEQERRPVQLQIIVDEALKLLKATLPSTIEIVTKINPECSPVLADPTQMHQVILNLVTNAAHAIGGNEGSVRIELEQVSVNGGLAELSPGQYARLSVIDTGPGIPPEIQKRIFEPYFTTKSTGQGSGLGLAVVHGIVQSHNGGITVNSTQNQGTCFEVYLPCCSQNLITAPAPIPELVNGKGRILLVDDEEAIVNLGRRSLQKLGYQVTCETRSISALEKFKTDPGQFDLVVTDQTMPHLTGLSLAQELWKIRPNLPVIISTGYSEQITSDKAASLGFHTLLNKPYTASELAKAIKQSLA